jgi:hypothetical protein
MATPAIPLCAGLLAACCLGGCAITQMRTENERLGGQLRVKEQQLQREQETQESLQAANRRLLDDLQSRELTVSELGQRLQDLRRLNAATAATTEAQRQLKAERDRHLGQAANEVRSMQQVQQDTTSSQDAKARQLEARRRELRKKLELLSTM